MALGAWVAATRILDAGPTITIDFRTGDGLEAGKTKIKFKGVEIGTLTTLALTGKEQKVRGTAEMEPGTEDFLFDDTRFWVVKPRISGANVSGLTTLISGSYVALDFGKSGDKGKPARSFVALKVPPVVYADVPGRFFTLKTPDLGSLDTGAPVFYRRLEVGQVASYELDKDGQSLSVRIYVNAPYDQYVNSNTRFWNASGIDVSLSSAGISVETQSVLSVMIGGIAFETPVDGTARPQAAEDTVFPLYDSRDAAFRPPAHDPQTYQLVFTQSVRGLSPGASVEFHGIPIGEVVSLDARLDPETFEFAVPVIIRLDTGRLGVNVAAPTDGSDPVKLRRSLMENLIAHGVRAQLRTGSLLTGAMYVAFDTFADAPTVTLDWSRQPVQLPTMPGQLDAMEATVGRILAKIDGLPIEEIGSDVQKAAAELKSTLVSARGALDSARSTLDNTGKLVEPNSALNSDLAKTLREVSQTARSVRVLADYLERHPESLIRGKTGDSK
jgi:paraquat-inducible protein B